MKMSKSLYGWAGLLGFVLAASNAPLFAEGESAAKIVKRLAPPPAKLKGHQSGNLAYTNKVSYTVGAKAAANSVFAPWDVPDLCKAYNFPKRLARGNGVIGILELGGGYLQSDLDQFSSFYGMPKIPVIPISIDGTKNDPGKSFDDIEVTLDIEIAAASYFYATGKVPLIYVFFAKNDFDEASFSETITAATALGCDTLSISWGAPEDIWSEFSTAESPNVVNAACAAANAAGLTIFAASGDNSSSDGFDTGYPNVDFPASAPNVVGCGGTTKPNVKPAVEEVVWGDGDPFSSGTGGGFSRIFPKQTFQTGAPAAPPLLGRLVPDVSAVADPETGYIIYWGTLAQYGYTPGWYAVGGTSCVAPLYAGLFAAFGKNQGFVTKALWANKQAFVDIKKGSNGDYKALTGPDACTGLGVPDGTKLSNLFINHPAPDNNVYVSYSAINNTLFMAGDAFKNNVTITHNTKAQTLQITGSKGTKINNKTTTLVIYHVTSPRFFVDLGLENDLILFNAISNPHTKSWVHLEDGSDTLATLQCSFGTLWAFGGAGTNLLSTISSKFEELDAVGFVSPSLNPSVASK